MAYKVPGGSEGVLSTRPVLPGQNTNNWVHNVTGEEGVYSNWSLQSSTHLLEDAPLRDHIPGTGYHPNGVLLTQMFLGDQEYLPMELAKFSHGGQKWSVSFEANQPWLLHKYWEYNGVSGSEVFTRYAAATPAVVETGTVTLADWTTGTGTNFSFDVNTATVTVDGDYTSSDLQTLVNDIDSQLGVDVVASISAAGDGIAFTSVDTGAAAEVTTTIATEINLAAETANGTDESGTFWGYTVEDAKARDFTFSRHSNWHFYGVASADATFDGRIALTWDDPNLPSYARRHAPYEYKGVGDDVHLLDAGEPLSVKYTRAEESNEYAHQRTKQHFGVSSSKALSV